MAATAALTYVKRMSRRSCRRWEVRCHLAYVLTRAAQPVARQYPALTSKFTQDWAAATRFGEADDGIVTDRHLDRVRYQ